MVPSLNVACLSLRPASLSDSLHCFKLPYVFIVRKHLWSVSWVQGAALLSCCWERKSHWQKFCLHDDHRSFWQATCWLTDAGLHPGSSYSVSCHLRNGFESSQRVCWRHINLSSANSWKRNYLLHPSTSDSKLFLKWELLEWKFTWYCIKRNEALKLINFSNQRRCNKSKCHSCTRWRSISSIWDVHN